MQDHKNSRPETESLIKTQNVRKRGQIDKGMEG
jgi:hypothetical protein